MSNGPGWYDGDPDLSQLYQGDVLRDIPFPNWPTIIAATHVEKMPVLRVMEGGKRTPKPIDRLPNFLESQARSQVQDAFNNLERREYVMAECRLRNVMVLTRACQLDHKDRKYAVVAPVTAIEDLPSEQKRDDILAATRKREIPHRFYLPERGELRESFADFFRMTTIHRSLFPGREEIAKSLVSRLSSVGQSTLQLSLAHHFGQGFGFDHQNVVPQDGWYNCSNCFYQGMDTVRRRYLKGQTFGLCSKCGEDAQYVKVPI
ncbi:MAG TPA: hypothetical protein VGF96_15770 [Terracidiphilus sp.]|jgi:hypothetical protein